MGQGERVACARYHGQNISMVTVITRKGNILEVSPPNEGVLRDVLSYTYFRKGLVYGQETINKIVSSYSVIGDKLYTTQGALKLITDRFTELGIQYTCADTGKVLLNPDYEYAEVTIGPVEFRHNQDEALAAIISNDSGVIEAVTAYGKTFLITLAAVLYHKHRILILTPSKTLFNSTYRRLMEHTADVGRVGNGYSETGMRIVLCTFRSILKAANQQYDVVFVDECHGLAADGCSSDFVKLKRYQKCIGLSATAFDRIDGANKLVEMMIGPSIFKTTYQSAVDAGSVVPINVEMIPVTKGPSSEVYQSTLAKKRNLYWNNLGRNKVIANALPDIAKKYNLRSDYQSLIIATTVIHAFQLSRYLPGYTVVYGGLSKAQLDKAKKMGAVDDDYKALRPKQLEELQKSFEADKLKHVIATTVWGEGVDFPALDMLVNVSGESTPIQLTQWTGRLSRINPSTGKSMGVVVDTMDDWDTWALGRAKQRRRQYLKNGGYMAT